MKGVSIKLGKEMMEYNQLMEIRLRINIIL